MSTTVFMRVPIAPHSAVWPTLSNGKPNPGYGRFGLNEHINDFNSYLDLVDLYYTQFKPVAKEYGVKLGVEPIMGLGRSPNMVPFALGQTGYRIDMAAELSREYRWLFQAFGIAFMGSEAENTRAFFGGHPSMGFVDANMLTVTETVDCIFDASTTQDADSPLLQDILSSNRKHVLEANAIHEHPDVDLLPRAADWRLWDSKLDRRHTIVGAPKGSQVDFRNGIGEEEMETFKQACMSGINISVNGLGLWDVNEFFYTVAKSNIAENMRAADA